MKRIEEVSTVILYTSSYIDNVFAYVKYEDAEKKALAVANNWYDKKFKDIYELFEWQDSEEFLDMCCDNRIGLETSILEGDQ